MRKEDGVASQSPEGDESPPLDCYGKMDLQDMRDTVSAERTAARDMRNMLR